MKTLLLTGASGFIAHHVIREAQEGKWNVVGVDKRPMSKKHNQPNHFILTDVMDLNYRDLMNVDAVVHLAWRTNIGDCIRHPEKSTNDNIDMTVHLLEVCREAKVKKVIFPSTASLYSFNKTPWTEDMKVEAIEHYSWQKQACEELCQMYSNYFDLPTVIMRYFQVYGEMQRDDTVIAVFMKKLREGKPATLLKTKNEKQGKSGQRDFIYAGDIAKAIMLAVKNKHVGKGEIFNICTGKLNTIEEIVTLMKMKVEWLPTRPYDVDRHLGDNKKARLILGWQPRTEVMKWLTNYIKV